MNQIVCTTYLIPGQVYWCWTCSRFLMVDHDIFVLVDINIGDVSRLEIFTLVFPRESISNQLQLSSAWGC